MVAVRMVSEGVDVPRLAVGVYATSTSTPLFFAQAVGRFVRARARGETASVFVPSIPSLLLYASEMERERDHALRPASEVDEEQLLIAAERAESEADLEQGEFAALASEADFDRVVFDGGEFGLTASSGSADEADYLGIPGLLEPEQMKDLLRRRQSEQVARGPRDAAGTDPHQRLTERSTHQQLRELRKELNGLVGAWHHRTDQPHGVIHAELRAACGGPPTAAASAEELQQRIDHLRRWATSGRGR
jgi:superfamily II DNA or RNA helicase